MSIGLFGGTFDPIHVGHLDVALAALDALDLEEIWFIPAGHPPHRAQPGASAAHRFAMVALAISGRPQMRLSDIEMGLEGPSFTIDTLDRLDLRHPSFAGRWCLVTGADAFADIRTWRAWARLIDRCRFAVVSRPGHPVDNLPTILPELAPRMRKAPTEASADIVLIDAVTTDVSATALRAAFAGGGDLSALLPATVAEYAVRERLYVTGETERG